MKKILFKADVIKGKRQFDKGQVLDAAILYVGETHDLDSFIRDVIV